MQNKKELRSAIVDGELRKVGKADIKEGVFNLPDGVTKIGVRAFYNCQSLVILNLAQAEQIESKAFKNCYNLTQVTGLEIINIKNEAFNHCKKLMNINLPKVTTIGKSAFSSCIGLTTVNAPQALTLKYASFFSCEKLIDIKIPKVTKIESFAFSNCSELPRINTPQVLSLGMGVFSMCRKLILINMPKVTKVKKPVFFGCTQLKTLVLHPQVSFHPTEFESSRLQRIVINDSEITDFDINAFISKLPDNLKNKEMILASEQIKSLCNVQEVLNQHSVRDIHQLILSFSHRLGFFPSATLSATPSNAWAKSFPCLK